MVLTYNKELTVRYEADVLVAGGGPAGVAAAVMAAEAGAKVLIIEQSGSFGGVGTLGMVPEIMNFDDGEHFLADGFGKRLHDALFPPCKFEREWMIASPEDTKRLYDKMIAEAGVEYLFFNKLTDAVVKDGRITHAIVSAPEGIYAIKAKYFIDTTGNGALAALSGCGFDFGDENGITMPATLCSLWGNVDFDVLDIEQQRAEVEKAYRDGVLTQYDTILPGMKPIFPDCKVAGGNIGHAFAVKDTESRSLSDAMTKSRAILAEYERYYKEYVLP
jgi:ribulose 1,5-bisphosphate synthetase/thiazole synthase